MYVVRLIRFKSISIKNFLSVGETPVVINFRPGVNIITGVNHDKEDSKNGVGKSTIVDALYFALFGTTIREISKDLIVNSFAQKQCEVILDFSIENGSGHTSYQIVRTIGPTKCFVTRDGEDVTHSTMAKTNEFIQRLILSNGKIFQNSVIMTINNTVPFMAQSKIDKRKFIESILSLEIFSGMLSKARDEHNTVKRDYEILFTKLEGIKKGYSFNREQLDTFEKNKIQKIEELNKKITDNKTKIAALEKDIKDIPVKALDMLDDLEKKYVHEINELDKQYREVYQKLADNKSLITHAQAQIKLIDEKGSHCTTCNRPYSKNDIDSKEQNKNELLQKVEAWNTLLKEHTDNINNLNTLQKEAIQNKNNISTKRDKLKDIVYNNNNTRTKIETIKENNVDIQNEIKTIRQQTNSSLEEVVKDLFNKFQTGEAELKLLDQQCSVLEIVKFVVSEEGVKSYIVKKILSVLNGRMAYYLEKLQANCLCRFDEFFDEYITDEKGQQKSYFNFSGGERKRIDLACLFAFLDIRRMQGDIHFSTIFYDELLDSSLDDKGVELVLDILRERVVKYGENCYIITHRGTAVIDKIDNTVMLEKRNNFTYVL